MGQRMNEVAEGAAAAEVARQRDPRSSHPSGATEFVPTPEQTRRRTRPPKVSSTVCSIRRLRPPQNAPSSGCALLRQRGWQISAEATSRSRNSSSRKLTNLSSGIRYHRSRLCLKRGRPEVNIVYLEDPFD